MKNIFINRNTTASTTLNYMGIDFALSEMKALATHARSDELFGYEDIILTKYPKLGRDIIAMTYTPVTNNTEAKAILTKALYSIDYELLKRELWDDMTTPDVVEEEFNQAVIYGTNGTREQTYIKSEYKELALLACKLKLCLPVILQIMTYMATKLQSKDGLVMLYRFINDLLPKAPLERLKEYVSSVNNKAIVKPEARMIAMGIGEVDISDFIMGNVVLLRLPLGVFRNQIDNSKVIYSILNTVNTLATAGVGSKPAYDLKPPSYGDGEGKEVSILDIDTQALVPVDRVLVIERFLEEDGLIKALGIKDITLLNRANKTFFSYREIEPSEFNRIVSMYICSIAIDPRWIRSLDIKYITAVMASSFVWLIEHQLFTLASLLLTRESINGSSVIGVNTTPNKLMEEMEEHVNGLNINSVAATVTKTLKDKYVSIADHPRLVQAISKGSTPNIGDIFMKDARSELSKLIIEISIDLKEE